MSEVDTPPVSPPDTRRFRLSLDTWAVLLAATLTVLVIGHVLRSVPW